MVTSLFLWGLCGYIWDNILTLSPPRGLNVSKKEIVKECVAVVDYVDRYNVSDISSAISKLKWN